MSDMPWQSALCFVCAVALAGVLLAGWIAKWMEGAEMRAIKRARKRRREAWKYIRKTSTTFQNSQVKDWNCK
jgi:hypothetical protein